MLPQAEEVVRRDLEVIVPLARDHLPGLRCLLLGGSFGRGEGSVVWRDGKWVPFKDYDFFAIVEPSCIGRAAARIPTLRGHIYEALGYPVSHERGISPGSFHVGFSLMAVNELHRLPHDVSNVELKLASTLVWGEDLRPLIASDPALIPPASGLRPVLNKLIGVVEMAHPWTGSGCSEGEMARAIAYERAKMVLDAVALVLLMARAWTVGYRARCERLRDLEAKGFTSSLGPLSSRCEEALRFKASPRIPEGSFADLWACTRDELLTMVGALAESTLRLPQSLFPPEAFLNHGTRMFIPFAHHVLSSHHLPAAMAPWLAGAYCVVENLRLGFLRFAHPLVRAWAAAWAWLWASGEPTQRSRALHFASRTVGADTEDPETLRYAIVALFKAASTARRRKRTL